MASIRERKNSKGETSYTVEVRLKGFPPQTATFKRKTDAKAWAQQTEAAIREGRHFKTVEAKKRTLFDLIEKYKANQLNQRGRDRETVEPHLVWWDKKLGKYSLAEITPQLIAEQRDFLINEPLGKDGQKRRAAATIIRYLASLSVCLTYGVRDLGWLDKNPCKEVTKPKPARGRVRFLSDEERQKLLKTCKENKKSKHLYTVVLIALTTGARMSEITGLKWKDLDFKRSRMTFEDTKNGERRSAPILLEVMPLLVERAKIRRIDTDYVFPQRDKNEPIDVRKVFARSVIKAEIEDFRFHDLRHTAASYLAMNGASLLEIAEILGHKTLSMVKRYSHLTETHTHEIMQRTATEKLNQEVQEYFK